MKTTITTLLTLLLVVAVFAPAKAGNPVNKTGEKSVVKKLVQAVSNPSVNALEKCSDEQKCNDQNAPEASSPIEGQNIKYGSVIQDGQIMIIQNKPVRLFA